MTLDTRILLDGPIHGRTAFRVALAALLEAAGEAHKIDTAAVQERHAASGDRIWTRIGQGLPGIVEVEFNEDGSPLASDDVYVQDDPDEEPRIDQRSCQVEISWDTGYGYRDDHNATCTQLHAAALARLHASLPDGVTMRWENEFTGEVHDGLSEEDVRAFVGHGVDVVVWFETSLRPILAGDRS